MAEVSLWEQAFVRAYIVAEKRDRYLAFLKGRKHRRKILDRLNHSLDYDERYATPLDARYKIPKALIVYLIGRGVDRLTCCLMADGHSADGRHMRLEQAVLELLDSHWGALIICPPIPIAVYKPEDIGDLVLLARLP
ncbi:MAG: hypothetical protein U0905_09190 [Pirellulales bacterium]